MLVAGTAYEEVKRDAPIGTAVQVANPFGEKVSVMTPLGAALLGSRVGDIVEWQTRRGPRRVRVEEVVFQPEAAPSCYWPGRV